MTDPKHKTDPGNKGRPFLEEADIGSGEKNPGQLETEEMIRQIPPLPHPDKQQGGGGQQGEQSPASTSPPKPQAVRP
jgi:hypothetical protein